MRRIDVIREIMSHKDTDLVVASVGMISREVYTVMDRPENFYVQGSMGAALGIGIGVALNTDRNVHVIAGDGEVLMSLGTLVLMNKLQLPNLKLTILDNNCYQTTGGQKTCSDAVDFRLLCDCAVVKVEDSGGKVERIGIPHKEIARRFRNAVGV